MKILDFIIENKNGIKRNTRVEKSVTRANRAIAHAQMVSGENPVIHVEEDLDEVSNEEDLEESNEEDLEESNEGRFGGKSNEEDLEEENISEIPEIPLQLHPQDPPQIPSQLHPQDPLQVPLLPVKFPKILQSQRKMQILLCICLCILVLLLYRDELISGYFIFAFRQIFLIFNFVRNKFLDYCIVFFQNFGNFEPSFFSIFER